ncbi:enoyl-CoA hydratase-related protein [Thauera mechernichensis]|uniref:Enoyl-CoA hydratase-related protein n=1 Tax=Thauera mechernichensis TaxID=82788 RepID=A0ABW3WKT6_9RHOO|nr:MULTISPECIES: enoyl-CoA hydratase-related protein [Thauera]HNR60998.1 enoyl-CoA hydratase-related protein [Thauera sp.]ENO81257.1 enoyl-CoA hydratase [Thauera sp. 27]MDG3066498.1 enoyl-CoA hydratase-related protein [Thauera mechernichensis]WBL65340.1 enoyl-CoA hydratase-related protein [Thauera sp. WB-2]HNS93951.1 enoyl-CoA hydratase-related protein [Thauera sp.]
MTYDTLAIERCGAVATVWMDRPEVFNAFDEQLIAELAAACAALDADAGVRVVVLAGRGKHFSAGADLNWMRRAADSSEADNLADSRKFAAMLHTLASMSKPTIARVQGAALGGGTGLTAACDMAIAAADASFATSEVKFGIIPAVISPYVLRAIGPRHALRYFQSAERFGAAEAKAMGLVSEVVAVDELDAAVDRLVQALLACGPQAQLAAKQLIAAINGRPIDPEVGEETATRIARQRATAEAREGFAAFFEKRQPAWMA